MYYIGIDNGLHGALAMISENKKIETVYGYTKDLFTTGVLLSSLIKEYDNINAVLEKPIMGGNRDGYALGSMFRVYGQWETLLKINNIPFIDANPAIRHKDCWRKEFKFKSIKSVDLKNESIKICLDLFPDAGKWIKREKPIKGKNGRKEVLTDFYDDNKAESILLAEFCRRMNI